MFPYFLIKMFVIVCDLDDLKTSLVVLKFFLGPMSAWTFGWKKNQKECVFLGIFKNLYVYNKVMDVTSIGIKINHFG